MSYNVDSTQYIAGSLQIHRNDVLRFVDEIGEPRGDNLAESCFLEGLDLDEPPSDGWYDIKRPSWSGVWSGKGFDTFKELLQATRGAADILVTWEGGDSIEGIRVVDGELIDVELQFVLTLKGEPAPRTLPKSRMELLMETE